MVVDQESGGSPSAKRSTSRQSLLSLPESSVPLGEWTIEQLELFQQRRAQRLEDLRQKERILHKKCQGDVSEAFD
jgi:hypothetical protein